MMEMKHQHFLLSKAEWFCDEDFLSEQMRCFDEKALLLLEERQGNYKFKKAFKKTIRDRKYLLRSRRTDNDFKMLFGVPIILFSWLGVPYGSLHFLGVFVLFGVFVGVYVGEVGIGDPGRILRFVADCLLDRLSSSLLLCCIAFNGVFGVFDFSDVKLQKYKSFCNFYALFYHEVIEESSSGVKSSSHKRSARRFSKIIVLKNSRLLGK